MILAPLTPALPPTPRLFTLPPGLSSLQICPSDGCRGKGAPPPLCLPPPRPSLSVTAPAAGARARSSRRPGTDSWSDLSKC